MIYCLSLLAIGSSLFILPVVYIDISIKTTGIVRPLHERTEIRSVVPGVIDSVMYKEGDLVQKGATIIRIRDRATGNKRRQHQFEIFQREPFVHDLEILLAAKEITRDILTRLISPLYKQQTERFLIQKTEYEASLAKAAKELEINASLAKDKVISSKEFFDIKVNFEKARSVYQAFAQEQLSRWQQDLVSYGLALSQSRQQVQQIDIDAGYYEVRSPVTGSIQGINTLYAGSLLQANEPICSISPEEKMIGECYVRTKDIGLLKNGQLARFRFEAFDYRYFGVLTGRITGIDHDFTLVENTPVFKVRCVFDSTRLCLKNGFAGRLKKGLGFQASFMVTRRSLWQLLFDKLDDWFNPNTLPETL